MAAVGKVGSRFVAALAAILLPALWACAWDYRQTHYFTLTPGGNVLPQVTGYYFEHAWDAQAGHNLHSDVVPAGQAAGFQPFGLDWMQRAKQGARLVNDGGIPVNLGSFAVPAAGTDFTSFAHVGPDSTTADAYSHIAVNPYAAGRSVSGVIETYGGVTLGPVYPAKGYSAAYSEVVARGGFDLGKGNIKWLPAVHDAVFGRRYDPIDFQVFDSLGESLMSDSLFWQEADIDALGTYSWENGVLAVKSPGSFDFHLALPGQYTSIGGKLDLVVVDGVVASADDSGIFDGLLPSVGASATDLTLQLPTEYDFDYDLGLSATSGDTVQLEFDNMGQSLKGADVPGPLSAVVFFLGVGYAMWSRRRRD